MQSGRPRRAAISRSVRRSRARVNARLAGLDPLWIDLDDLVLVAPEAKGRTATRVALRRELGREALLDPAAVAAQPGLGRLGQIDELIPVALATREDLLVAEPDRHSRRMKLVFEDVEGLTQVALPAIDVGRPRGRRRRRPEPPRSPRASSGEVHGRAGAGDAELDAGVDQAEAGHGGRDQAALGRRAIAVELAGRALSDPDGRSQAAQVVRVPGQAHRWFLLLGVTMIALFGDSVCSRARRSSMASRPSARTRTRRSGQAVVAVRGPEPQTAGKGEARDCFRRGGRGLVWPSVAWYSSAHPNGAPWPRKALQRCCWRACESGTSGPDRPDRRWSCRPGPRTGGARRRRRRPGRSRVTRRAGPRAVRTLHPGRLVARVGAVGGSRPLDRSGRLVGPEGTGARHPPTPSGGSGFA